MVSAAKTLRVTFVQCRGTPYEVGRAQADAFAATRKGKAFLRRKTVRLPWWLNIHTEERAFRAYAPAVWEEIGGIAEGLNIPMEHAVFFFGNEGLRMPTGGCSRTPRATGSTSCSARRPTTVGPTRHGPGRGVDPPRAARVGVLRQPIPGTRARMALIGRHCPGRE